MTNTSETTLNIIRELTSRVNDLSALADFWMQECKRARADLAEAQRRLELETNWRKDGPII